jgi:hypothetical protein
MDQWSIISSLSKMKENVGDKLLVNGVECTIEIIQDGYVTLSNGKVFPKEIFHDWWQLMLKHESLKKAYADRKKYYKQLELDKANEPLGSDFPSAQMRYIIIVDKEYDEDYEEDVEIYKFYFASRHTSHSELAEEAKKVYPTCRTVAGGFYTRRSANALRATFGDYRPYPYTLEILLYGVSDSYGLNLKYLNKAINDYYKQQGNHVKITVID